MRIGLGVIKLGLRLPNLSHAYRRAYNMPLLRTNVSFIFVFCAGCFCFSQGCYLQLSIRRREDYTAITAGRDYSTVDGRSNRKCYWTRASSDCGRLQIGDVTREVEFLSDDYTNPNTNPRTLTSLALTLANHHDAFERFFAPVFCYFVRNYSYTVDGAVVTSITA